MSTLDAIDIKLLELLQNDSEMSTKELAATVNLSPTPVYERVKRLEHDGYIKKYVALLDAEKLHLGFTVFCNVKLVGHSYDVFHKFMKRVVEIPEVTECYGLAGDCDYLLKVRAPDMDYYQRFILDVLGRIESISSVNSMFVLSEVKHTHVLPLRTKQE